MTSQELRQKYLDFFISKGHKVIPNAPLLPENDPTTLFISAGMHPLVPYLLGEPHPEGKRLVGLQKCLRTGDIDEVGDRTHHTFFEMLGNWSLGDPASPSGGQGGYWKKEAIEWSFEFLTSKDWLGIDKEKLAVSVFAGDKDAPFDQESYDLWLGLGISKERIAKLPKENNWWGPAGETGPCGPDTEMFVWTGKGEVPASFDPDNSEWVEVWNDVFMEYEKKRKNNGEEFEFGILKQKNVDTGMGLERILAVLNGFDDDYKTELFWPIIEKIEEISGKNYEDNSKEFRVIADHLRAAIFIIADGIIVSNVGRGYILRRLIRRAITSLSKIKIRKEASISEIIDKIINVNKATYPVLDEISEGIKRAIKNEEIKFSAVFLPSQVKNAEEEILKIKNEKLSSPEAIEEIGRLSFNSLATYGLPVDFTLDRAVELGVIHTPKDRVKAEEFFNRELQKHQELSRTSSSGMFKGGLADSSEIVTQYHTATHLLQTALRQVLGPHVFQKGSNITSERLRFDFSHPEKLTPEQIGAIEDLVNQKIAENLPVSMEMMTLGQAREKGALSVFKGNEEDQVKVYIIGSFSREVCGGPHVDFTGPLGKFKIIKEEAASSGVRRVYAVLE